MKAEHGHNFKNYQIVINHIRVIDLFTKYNFQKSQGIKVKQVSNQKCTISKNISILRRYNYNKFGFIWSIFILTNKILREEIVWILPWAHTYYQKENH